MLYRERSQARRGSFIWPLFACILFLFIFRAVQAAEPGANRFHPVDLAKYFTDFGTNSLPSLSSGSKTFDGVRFILGGRIELAGMHAARSGEFLPAQVTAIPVGEKASRLHLLLGARHGQKDGVPLASVVLHFKNGESRSLRLAYGVHARNTFGTPETVRGELSDPNTRIAWKNPDATDANAARLYHAVFDNPRPELEIASMDLLSLFSPATPIIFSITLEAATNLPPLLSLPKRKTNQRAFQFPDSAYRRVVNLRVVDGASGQAVDDARALVSVKDDSETYFFGHYASDASGLIQIVYPPQQAVSLAVRVSSHKLVPTSLTLSGVELQSSGDTINVPLQRGASIGGFVVHPAGRAVSNATVIPFIVEPAGTNLYARTDLDTIRTDANGKWSAAAVAQSVTNLSFEIIHPEYHNFIADRVPAAELLAGNWRAVLRPHIQVVGHVLGENGKPLPNATVILDRGTNYPSVYTDRDGRFAFIVRDVTNATAGVIAIATNYAPSRQVATLQLEGAPVEFKLNSGSKFSMLLKDQNDRPVPDVDVSLTSWAGSKAMQWKTMTDKNGRFTWEHAPSGSVSFRLEKPGHYIRTHSITLPRTGEYTVAYGRRMTVAGRVLDAESQKPIEQFRLRVQYKYENGSGSTSTSGRRGAFTYPLGSEKFKEATVAIEARGYQPVSTTLLPDESGSFSNLFLLKKAVPIPGFVVGPDGAPAAGTQVVLVDKDNYAYMEEPGRFRSGYSDYDVAVADGNGRFELNPKLDPEMVLAAHRTLGFVQTWATNILKGEKLKLQPWSHIKGVVKVGEKVEPYYYIGIGNSQNYSREPREMRQAVYSYLKFKPDPDGRFSFDFVPPGDRTVHLRYQFEEGNNYGGARVSHAVSIDAKPGQTNEVVIGGTGRTVTGRAECTGPSASQVAWQLYGQTLRSIPKPIRSVAPRIPRPGATAEERQRILEEHNQAVQAAMRQQARAGNVEYSIVFDEDGKFHVYNLPPGEYNLSLSAVLETPSGGYRNIGSLHQRVTVPEGNDPYDLGTFTVKSNN